MTHLKDMSIEQLQAGYEKGKVTDEEIEQHLLEQIYKAVYDVVKMYYKDYDKNRIINSSPYHTSTVIAIKSLAEHEYQKLKGKQK